MTQLTATPTTGILVYEKQPYWGPELKRQLADQLILVRESRSMQDLQSAADALKACVAVAVIDAAPAEFLSWMSRKSPEDRNWPLIVIASRELAELEWPLREAGAEEFVDDEIAGDRLARLCRRLLRK